MKMYIVIGGHLTDVQDVYTLDPKHAEFIGFFKDESTAQTAWRDLSQKNVDQAHKRYFVLPVDISPLHQTNN